jgi:hypothetical protein
MTSAATASPVGTQHAVDLHNPTYVEAVENGLVAGALKYAVDVNIGLCSVEPGPVDPDAADSGDLT